VAALKTPTRTAAELLRASGLKAKHSWGQNFLSDEGVLERIAAEAEVGEGDTVLELGAGLGHLTRALLATKANVVAVERDREVAAVLRRELPELKLVEANAAELDFAATAGVPDLVLVGNLPYHLSSPILFVVLDLWRAV
jgi:16S rRNA (adenine1518-N6/adenine1519-N6)-dimethyltransferase